MLGFCYKWVKWIWGCLESSSIFVLVNQSPTKEFKLSKELRQEDPLTPFLFLIVAEELVGVVRLVEIKRLLERIKFGNK